MSEFFAQPDDFGEPRASELHTSLGQSLGAQANESFMSGFNLVGRHLQYTAAEHGWDAFLRGAASQDQSIHPDAPDVAIDDARKRVKDEGLEGELKMPAQPHIRAPVLDMMIRDAHERRDYNAAVNRGPQGFFPGALGFVTQIGAGMVDPVNIAAFSVPVVGEARTGALLARAGEGILARAGVRAGIGAAQGAVGTAALQPADWWLHTRDGVDYTMADALKSIALGMAMGGVAHAGLGVFGDLRARLKGLPLEHSPEDQVIRALVEAQEGRRAAAESEPTSTAAAGEATPRAPERDLAGAAREVVAHPDFDTRGSALDYDGIHPGEIFADLPPAVRGDLVRTAAAGVIRDEPGRAGEVLAIGAQQDPRIAESVRLESTRLRADQPLLVAARRMPDGSVKYGRRGEVHSDLMTRRELAAEGPTAPEIAGEMGYADPYGAFMTRQEALEFARQHEPGRAAFSAEQPEHGLEAASYFEPRARSANVLPGPPAAKGPRARPARTFSLFEFLSQRGGLAPHPDVASIFGGKNPFVPGFGRLIRKTGMSLDRAREAAVEAGYLHDPAQQHGGVTESTINHLLDAMDAEARGNRLYRPGEERAGGANRDEELHHINREIDAVLAENGHDIHAIPDKTRARVVEIMDREGVRDPLVAYERALLEEDRNGTENGQHPADRPIAGFDVSEDAGRAPGEGGRAGGEQPEAGGPARAAGRDDGRPPGRGDPDAWRRLGERQRDPDAERDVAASKAAEGEPEPASVDPTKSVSAAEAAAAEAEKLRADIESQLTEAERTQFRDALDELAADKTARETILRDGAACLIEAVA